MDDFLTYFLAGMFGEELLRKIATRPYGFMILWLMGFILFNVLIVLFIVLVPFLKGVANPPIWIYLREAANFFFVTIQPWPTLFSLGMGLMFALGYRWHYRNKLRDKQ